MKLRIFLLSLSFMFVVALHAQTYHQLWRNVEQMEKQDLPKSVIAKAEEIYAKAKKEHHVPQMMKAYLTMMTWRGNISPDSIPVDMKGLEEWVSQKDTEVQDRAVLYSILGELCIRKDFEKANRYLQLSLKDSLKLLDYPADKLVPMVKSGETSRLYFDNNLYDLLARRAIQLWERNLWNSQQEDTRKSIQETYQSLLHIYKVKGMRPAWLLTALDAYPQADEKQLRAWMKEYADLDVCAEVYLRLANWMLREDEPSKRLTLLREGINRYPRYNRINALKNEEKEILAAQLNVSVDYTCPDEPIAMRVNHRNLHGFTVKLYQLNLSAESASLSKVSPTNVKKYGTLLRQEYFNLPSTPDYRVRTDTLHMKPLKAGIYYAVAIPDGHRDIVRGSLLQVTGLQVIYRSRFLPGKQVEIVVLDKQSGHPVANAQVNVYQEKGDGYERTESHTANAEGVVMMSRDDNRFLSFQASTATDQSMPITQIWLGNSRYQVPDKQENHISLFTDRSLYRLGQTLHFAGIVYSQQKDNVRAKEGWTQTVVLLDADGREVAKQEVETDAFGTIQGTFELPRSGKMGVYRLRTDKGMTTFRVEEYKRPTFEVMFDTVRTSYQAGDSIQATGIARTFAGTPVQGARVKYTVVRLENSFWRMRGLETNRVTGETVTDADGRFEVPIHFLPIAEGLRSWYYTYEVLADVTSVAGETQEGTLNLPLGSSSLRLFVPDWEGVTLIKEDPSKELTFQVNNLMNVSVETEVDYRVLKDGKVVWQGKANSNQSFLPKNLYGLPSGKYLLKAEVRDEHGHVSEQTVAFSVFSLKDRRLPEGTGVWCYQPSEEFDAEGQAIIYFGSSDKDVYLFYDVAYGDNRIERKRITFSDSLMTFRYTYREEYGDGLRCNFAYLKNGELYVRNLYIKKPKPEKALQLKWRTFRDKLQPGQQETWTLSIFRPDGKPADAQLMATMYDASLDKLAPHAWHFGLAFARNFPNISWRLTASWYAHWGFSFPIKALKYSPLAYSQLDFPSNLGVEEQGLRMYKANVATGKAVVEMKYVPPTLTDAEAEEESVDETTNVQLRSNFAETAFFYPQLRTDDRGDVQIEFTLPESLTEWKFMGLAHTREMDYGSIEAQVVASKDFMLQSNLPRFVRVGDKVSVAASLMNLSDKEVKGVVRMELFVPDTEKVILSQKRPFRMKSGKTDTISFSFEVTDKYENLAVRMVADGGLFSDGEQRYLPVLSNKQRLTESVLLDVNGTGTHTFSLESLFNGHSKTVSRPEMWIEFTGNPMWYAIQALKVVSLPENDNALSWASAYYANALLGHLAEAEPRIADSLKVEGLEGKLLDAKLKMKDLQLGDGSWSWYKGMDGSLYMTLSITQLLARLQQMADGFGDVEVSGMYQKALAYLDKQVTEEVHRMKEAEKRSQQEIIPSEWTLQYLYIKALDKDKKKENEVTRYLVDKLTKMSGRLTIYGKAMSAIVLQEAGKKKEAKEFLQSMMQYSVMKPEMGRYFDSPKATYSWLSYKIPTQVAAIEAVRSVANEEKTQEKMKQWLLKQKQAQVWDTPIATTDAVYALLTTGADWLLNRGEGEIIIREGKNKIREDILKFGDDGSLGYISHKIQGDVMNVREVKVKQSSSGIGWGAVYAEFEEELDKVKAQGNALKIVRTLSKDGRLLTSGEALQVGDRLTIRLSVVADRDMDFVQIKDERAACLEPVDVLSGYQWNSRTGYYQETKDASTLFYIDKMPKGTYELEYDVYVTLSGKYMPGIATVQSVYAPEFVGHADGESLLVK